MKSQLVDQNFIFFIKLKKLKGVLANNTFETETFMKPNCLINFSVKTIHIINVFETFFGNHVD